MLYDISNPHTAQPSTRTICIAMYRAKSVSSRRRLLLLILIRLRSFPDFFLLEISDCS